MLCNIFLENMLFFQVQEHAISSFAKSPTLPDIPDCCQGMRIRSQGLYRLKHFSSPLAQIVQIELKMSCFRICRKAFLPSLSRVSKKPGGQSVKQDQDTPAFFASVSKSAAAAARCP